MTFAPHEELGPPPEAAHDIHTTRWTKRLYGFLQTWFNKQRSLGVGVSYDTSDRVQSTSADNPQYTLVDGTRPFTGTVGGIAPVATSDLATKAYVDAGGSSGRTKLYATDAVPGGNTISNDATEKTFTSSFPVPANSLKVGSALRVVMTGVYSTALVAPTVKARAYLGTTVIQDTGVLATFVGSLTNVGWRGQIDITVADAGAGGHVEVQGVLWFETAATAALTVLVMNAAPIALDTTISQAFTVTVQMGTANASNSFTLRQMVAEF